MKSHPLNNLNLYGKLATLPDDLRSQVADFVDFLSDRNLESGNRKKPQFGSGKGMFVIKPDFDEPLEDFKEYMY